MIDDALSKIRHLVAAKKVTLGQVSEATGLPYSTVHEMLQEDWSTRAVENIRKLERGLPVIEAIMAKEVTQ